LGGGAGESLEALPEEEYTVSGRLVLEEEERGGGGERGAARRGVEEDEEEELMPWELPAHKANKVPPPLPLSRPLALSLLRALSSSASASSLVLLLPASPLETRISSASLQPELSQAPADGGHR